MTHATEDTDQSNSQPRTRPLATNEEDAATRIQAIMRGRTARKEAVARPLEVRFEVQFHTPKSFLSKQSNHEIYAQMRDLDGAKNLFAK